MSDNTTWTNRHESDSPSKDPQKGTPTDEFIEIDPNRKAPENNKEGHPFTDSNQPATQNPTTGSDDNPIMGTENTFNDTDPNRYNNNAGLGLPDNEKDDVRNEDTIGNP